MGRYPTRACTGRVRQSVLRTSLSRPPLKPIHYLESRSSWRGPELVRHTAYRLISDPSSRLRPVSTGYEARRRLFKIPTTSPHGSSTSPTDEPSTMTSQQPNLSVALRALSGVRC
jgi:hypothetical protein